MRAPPQDVRRRNTSRDGRQQPPLERVPDGAAVPRFSPRKNASKRGGESSKSLKQPKADNGRSTSPSGQKRQPSKLPTIANAPAKGKRGRRRLQIGLKSTASTIVNTFLPSLRSTSRQARKQRRNVVATFGDDDVVPPLNLQSYHRAKAFQTADANYCGLIAACRANDSKAIRALLVQPELRQRVNQQIEMISEAGHVESMTPCDIAAQCGNLSAVVALVRYGKATMEPTLVEMAYGQRKTALYYACLKGHMHIAKWLIAHNADPDFAQDTDPTALTVVVAEACATTDKAAKPKFLRLIHWLVTEGGASTNTLVPQSNVTPLYYAVDQGDVSVVRCLLSVGANPNIVFMQMPPGKAGVSKTDTGVSAGVCLRVCRVLA